MVSVMTTIEETALVALLDMPSLLIEADKVVFANRAATALLGAHIVGQDVRLALRQPDAMALINARDGGHAKVKGISVSGSLWDMACHVLSGGRRLVLLQDLSIQASVARAHADFVANASHELRTPLAAILGYVETLEDPKAGDDPATRARFLGIIRREAQRMQSLVEDLMSLSRIEAVKHDRPETVIDLAALVREAAGETQAEVVLDMKVVAPGVSVQGDRGQIAQVLRNLIDNAVKYGDPARPVTVILEATPDTGWASVSVHDEGEGIAPEHLPRLTERFYRADASRSRAVGGTGLGLSIVKHIIERHRGFFDISSRVGEGTTASIMLPTVQG
jgi:two-component system phosphate regulon sensor histidine kinase PhoR